MSTDRFDLLGRTLTWHPAEDPPGSWALSLDGDVQVEMEWSDSEGLVRAEFGDTVWRVERTGTLVLRSAVIDERGEPQVVYAGGMRRGLAEVRGERRFVFFSQMDRRVGPWLGVDELDGEGVFRMRGRVGGGGVWTEVRVTPDRAYLSYVLPLLLQWGGLQVLGRRWPHLRLTTAPVSDRTAWRALRSASPWAGGG